MAQDSLSTSGSLMMVVVHILKLLSAYKIETSVQGASKIKDIVRIKLNFKVNYS